MNEAFSFSLIQVPDPRVVAAAKIAAGELASPMIDAIRSVAAEKESLQSQLTAARRAAKEFMKEAAGYALKLDIAVQTLELIKDSGGRMDEELGVSFNGGWCAEQSSVALQDIDRIDV